MYQMFSWIFSKLTIKTRMRLINIVLLVIFIMGLKSFSIELFIFVFLFLPWNMLIPCDCYPVYCLLMRLRLSLNDTPRL